MTKEKTQSSDSKTYVVTGAATGIGSAICLQLTRSGHSVKGIGLDASEGRVLASQLQAIGGQFEFDEIDVTSAVDVEKYFQSLSGAHTPLDGVVNCAGIYPTPSRLEDVTLKMWQTVISVNLTGVFLVCRSALPLLRQTGKGSIVNISSVHAQMAARGEPAYAASKGALVSLTRQIAVDYAVDGIRANSLLVGSVDTRITRNAMAEAGSIEEIGLSFEPNSLTRISQPSEIAEVVAFLLSDAASFITGAGLVVDGGLTAKLL